MSKQNIPSLRPETKLQFYLPAVALDKQRAQLLCAAVSLPIKTMG